jgi:hypothetical protein
MPAAVVESAVEKLFFVEGRKKRAAKNNPAKPPAKKGKKDVEITEISRPIVSRRFTDQVVSLSDDGVLKIDGEFKIMYNKATMDLIKKLGIDRSKLSFKNSSCGYLYYGKDALHYILGAALKKQYFDSLVSRGFTGGSIDDLTHVSHNDGESINNNVSKLLNVPASWNYAFKKVK